MITITFKSSSYKKFLLIPKGVYININERYNDNLVTVDRFFVRLLNNESDKGRIVSTIIKIKYNQDSMDAIRNNYELVRDGKAGEYTEKYTQEYNDMQDWRRYAKDYADEILSSRNYD